MAPRTREQCAADAVRQLLPDGWKFTTDSGMVGTAVLRLEVGGILHMSLFPCVPAAFDLRADGVKPGSVRLAMAMFDAWASHVDG
jgi:hypothetical protein